MSTPAQEPRKGVPVERVLLVLGIFDLVGLVLLGTRGLFSQINLAAPPVVGEWQSPTKPWHITFRPDKTLVISKGGTEESGTYSVNFFGSLWVKLNSGKLYSAILSSEMPNRFDLIESDTQVPIEFERVKSSKPEGSAKTPSPRAGT